MGDSVSERAVVVVWSGSCSLEGDALQKMFFFCERVSRAQYVGRAFCFTYGSAPARSCSSLQPSLSVRVHLPLVIIATKTVARTKLRHARRSVYPDEELDYFDQ